MKKRATKIFSAFLAVLMVVLILPTGVITAKAETISSITPTVYSQIGDTTEYNYPDGSGATYDTSGCGVYAVVNAVKYLTGKKIDPHKLGAFAISCGARVYGGTLGAKLCQKAAASNEFGGNYGFCLTETYTFGSSNRTMTCTIGKTITSDKYPSTTEWEILHSKLVSHLQNGEVAVVLVMGHYMAIVDYDNNTGKFLMLDSAAYRAKRLSQNSGKWQWVTADQLNYNKAPKANSACNNQGPYIHLRSEIMFLSKAGENSTTQDSTNPDSYPIPERDLIYNSGSTVKTGDDVKWVQCVLKHLGYSIDIDGSYGPSSRDTIKKFQSSYGLTSDGMAGPNTRTKLKEVWASKGHSWDSGTVVTAATHTSTGNKTYKCNYCEATKNEIIPKTTPHSYSAWQNLNTTQHKRTCACGAYETTDHTWNSGSITQQPGCTTTGVKTYTCTGCSATKTETIAAKGHSFGNWQNYNSTQHKRSCSSCGVSETVNHTWDSGTIKKPATHTEEGLKTYTCTVCNVTKNETIAKISGHTYGSWQNLNATQHKRTCACNAYEIANHTWSSWQNLNATQHKRTCACGAYEIADHSWNSGVVTKAPSHTTEGIRTYTCTICSATKNETIEKLPDHTYVNGVCIYCGETDSSIVANGTCGNNLTWILYKSGELVISGTGAMWNYSDAPWYSHCSSIKTVTITNSVTSIGDSAFYKCDSLTSITIPDSVTSIGASALRYCTSLTSITIPNSVTTIGDYTFYHCTSLTNIAIPNNVTSIGDYAFSGCSSLTSITIPDSVTSIGDYAFFYCYNLEKIIYCGTSAEWITTVEKDANWNTNSGSYTLQYHDYDEGMIITAPTHTSEGIKDRTCILCGNTCVETVEKLPHHTYDIYRRYNRNQHKIFCVCGKFIYEDHTLVDDTCTVCGWFMNSKSDPNESFMGEEHSFCAHEWIGGDIVDFTVTYTCSKCSIKKVVELPYVAGDVNADGKININDIVWINMYLANYDYDTQNSFINIAPGADVDGNGNININDSILLNQYFANFDYDTGTSSVVLGKQS